MEVIQKYFNSLPPRTALKRTWFACLFFSLIYILISIIVGDDNHKSNYGTKAIGFAALWSSGMLLILMVASGIIIFYGKASSHLIGLLIGISGMLAQLFFVLCVVFLVYGDHAISTGHDPQSSDKAIGSFALFNVIVFGFWTAILWIYRDDLISNRQNSSVQLDIQPLNTKVSSSAPSSSSPTIQKNNTAYSPTPTSNLDHVPLHHDDDDEGVVDVDLEDSHTF